MPGLSGIPTAMEWAVSHWNERLSLLIKSNKFYDLTAGVQDTLGITIRNTYPSLCENTEGLNNQIMIKN